MSGEPAARLAALVIATAAAVSIAMPGAAVGAEGGRSAPRPTTPAEGGASVPEPGPELAADDAGEPQGDDPATAGDREGGAGEAPEPPAEGDHGAEEHGHSSRLSDQPRPLALEGFPDRPRYLIELGNPYLGTGTIDPGIELPTGAVWQPSLIVFGNLRTALQSFDGGAGDQRVTELATRLDLFANLQLSGTERLVVGFRNLDQDGRFTSYVLDPDPDDPAFLDRFGDRDRFREEANFRVRSLFFEGDFGELFPRLDRRDFGRTDVGFSIGRQPLLFQEGILIDDSIDGLGITRNTLLPKNTSNFRATFFLGVDDVHRSNGEDESAELYAILTSTDLRSSTVDLDLVFVDGGALSGDQASFGVSAVQRLGRYSTAFRLLGSRITAGGRGVDGALAFSELSWTPFGTHDHVYLNGFWAVDDFRSAARGPDAGGPLGRAGISFAAVGLGSFGAPLSSRARDVAGGAFGYQRFFGPRARRQLLTEVGLRAGTTSAVGDEAALTVRYQSAVGRRVVVVVDGFAGTRRPASGPSRTLSGGRLELVVKF